MKQSECEMLWPFIRDTKHSFSLIEVVFLPITVKNFIFLKVGVPISSVNQMDVYQENEELKEELQKLAAKANICCKVESNKNNYSLGRVL